MDALANSAQIRRLSVILPEQQTAVEITAAGGPDVLVPTRVAVLKPGVGQVLVRVNAAGVNRHDVHQRSAGRHSDGLAIPGLEVCGEVVACGSDVLEPAVGDRVMALVQGGGYAQYVLAQAVLCLPAPDTSSDVEAAGIPEALFTTWWNFFDLMPLEKTGFALIHGGTSGVGHLALQAMSALGYRVIATSGSNEKVKAALGFGACAAFNYNAPDLVQMVDEATNGQGVSALLDMSAGAHFEQDLEMMAPDGWIAHLSGGGGGTLEVPLRTIMAKRIKLTGSLLRPLSIDRKAVVADKIRRQVLPLLGHEVRPMIAAKFDFTQASEAHREMEAGQHIGKIILQVTHG
jgi:NADPH:quinone reductase